MTHYLAKLIVRQKQSSLDPGQQLKAAWDLLGRGAGSIQPPFELFKRAGVAGQVLSSCFAQAAQDYRILGDKEVLEGFLQVPDGLGGTNELHKELGGYFNSVGHGLLRLRM